MKNKFILLFSSFLLAGTSIGATKIKPSTASFKTTPLSMYGSTSFMELDIQASSANPLTVSVYIVNDTFTEGKLIFAGAYKSSTIETFEYDNTYTRDENKIKIVCKQTKVRIQTEYYLDVGLVSTSTNSLNSSYYTYVSKGTIAEYSNEDGIDDSKQILVFKGFEEKYIPDYYHKIDFSNFKIEDDISLNIPLFCESATFSITNPNGTFEAFGNDSAITIPLALVKDEAKKYHLGFKNKLYVNPITLEMSPTKKNGYVETNHFYLPRNGKQKENAYNCTIKISRMGIDYANFYSVFKYKSVLNTLGNCRNSEYCIVNR